MHSYIHTCNCARCTKERARRATQSASNTAWLSQHKPVKHQRKPRADHASRAEQHGRYIDCGYQNWDDNGQGDF